jgi:adenosylcobinamide-GDP ribazoletransferase
MEGIEALMRHLYLFALVGAALGGLFAASAYLLSLFLPTAVVAALILVVIYKLCGINHLDGLADFGDGVTAHGGSVDKKIQAMKDVNLGTGGGAFIAIILIVFFSTVASLPIPLIPAALMAAEVCAKQSMVTFAAFSRSFQKGFGQIMIERASSKDFFVGAIISAGLCAGVLGPLGVGMLASSVLSALWLIRVSKRNFGGGSGDGIGAANEIGRTIAMVAAVALEGILPWTLW